MVAGGEGRRCDGVLVPREAVQRGDQLIVKKMMSLRSLRSSPVSLHIVLMRTNVINLLNRVPEHDSLTFFVLHRTKCKRALCIVMHPV